MCSHRDSSSGSGASSLRLSGKVVRLNFQSREIGELEVHINWCGGAGVSSENIEMPEDCCM